MIYKPKFIFPLHLGVEIFFRVAAWCLAGSNRAACECFSTAISLKMSRSANHGHANIHFKIAMIVVLTLQSSVESVIAGAHTQSNKDCVLCHRQDD